MKSRRYAKIPVSKIPNSPCRCDEILCAYNDEKGMCDEPRTNKGNGDAVCHEYPNKRLLEYLETLNHL